MSKGKGADVDDLVRGGASWEQLLDGAEPMPIPAVKVSIPADAEDRPDEATQLRLGLDAKDRPRPSFANLGLILRHDPRWQGLRLCLLGHQVMLDGVIVPGPQLSLNAAIFLARVYGLDYGAQTIDGTILAVAGERMYNPVKDYLDALKWDGVERLGFVADEILGVERNALHTAYLRRFFIGAVARALNPGCKLDTALVLVGSQGIGKSTFFRVCFGEWFADSPIPIGQKDAFIQISACWGYEAAELESLSKVTAEAVKQFMSAAVDTYRGLWERYAVPRPRHSVMCGSTNTTQFLVDSTGSRRFWPVMVNGAIDLVKLRAWRDQLWAEAVAAFKAGEQWHLTAEEEQLREEQAPTHSEEDVWTAPIAEWLLKEGGQWILIPDVLDECLKVPKAQQHDGMGRRVGRILVKLGWSRKTTPQPLRLRLGPKSWSKD
jgi:putative DNA primase/helicase